VKLTGAELMVKEFYGSSMNLKRFEFGERRRRRRRENG